MDFVETEGETIDQAIDNALKQLGVARDRITVDIIAEGKKGILGFGAQKARIRASLRKSTIDLTEVEPATVTERAVTPAASSTAQPTAAAPAATPAITEAMIEKARTVLGDILRLMEVDATVTVKPGVSADETVLDVKAENSGLLIGRKGQTLEALQYLVSRIIDERQLGDGAHIVIDVENYRERRRQTLEDMALRLGEKAKRQRKTVTVDALSAADRRIIHAALQDDPWVTTRSLGQGSFRRLLIIPEGDRKKKDDGTSATSEKPSGRPAGRGNKPGPRTNNDQP